MKCKVVKSTLMLGVLLGLATFASAATQSFVGLLTDDMCVRKHTMMPGKPDADCVRACVKSGAKYALAVGDNVYILQGDNRQFDPLAGKKVKVEGDLQGKTVAVTSITEAK